MQSNKNLATNVINFELQNPQVNKHGSPGSYFMLRTVSGSAEKLTKV